MPVCLRLNMKVCLDSEKNLDCTSLRLIATPYRLVTLNTCSHMAIYHESLLLLVAIINTTAAEDK
jgi:hypothetical protein